MSIDAAEPFEVHYTRSGGRHRTRCVIGVLCPRPIPLLLNLAEPVFVDLGDVHADWQAEQSPGLRLLLQRSLA